jgi:hypothetical protein
MILGRPALTAAILKQSTIGQLVKQSHCEKEEQATKEDTVKKLPFNFW